MHLSPLVLILCTILTANSFAQSTSVHQINQQFKTDNIDSLVLEISAPVTYRKSPGHSLLIETTIEVEKATPAIMEVLTRSPRYKLIQTIENKKLILSAPKNNPVIKVSEEPVKEFIHYTVFLPKNLWYLQ